MEMNITIGSIIKDLKTGNRYRVISISNNEVILCQMDITRFVLESMQYQNIVDLIYDNEIAVDEEKMPVVIDPESLPEEIRQRYEKDLQMMHDIVNAYEQDFMKLDGKKKKPQAKEIMEKYDCPKTTFWRILTRYFQSGMQESSLVDMRALGFNKGKSYAPKEKAGKKPEYILNQGIVVNDEVKSYFDEALSYYKGGRERTLKSAYDRMNAKHYSTETIENGKKKFGLLPVTQRPTKEQFYYYAEKHLSKAEKDIIKTSAQEHRNDKRLLTGDSLDGVFGPGDLAEIDACEVDESVVAMIDLDQSVGRPVVYYMVDVYTRIILAVHVSFDNNSYRALSGLFLNLADDKQKFCRRYGVGFDNPDIWPSNIIPRRIRCDRGSDFRSKAFTRFCTENGIEKELVSGGSGSLKGTVEQLFNQTHKELNEHLEHKGLITKRHDSMHHKEAVLTIEEYTTLIILNVVKHNQQYMKDYPMTREMVDEGIEPRPVTLWQYGLQKYPAPKPIRNLEQYLYSTMIPVKASLSRSGITYKGLVYLPDNDPILKTDMFRIERKHVSFEVRMDPRCVDAVYYIRDSHLIRASLNPQATGNTGFENMTMFEYEQYLKLKKAMDANGAVIDQEMDAYYHMAEEGIVQSADKSNYSSDKNMRPARAVEKERVAKDNKIENTFPEELQLPEPADNDESDDLAEDQKSEHGEYKHYTSTKEALEDFYRSYEEE